MLQRLLGVRFTERWHASFSSSVGCRFHTWRFSPLDALLTLSSLASGSVFIGLAQGLKILAGGRGCSVVWTLVAAICSAIASSIPTLGKLAFLTWIGFASIFTAVFIVV